jgi:2-haloacid dehalogenase
MFEPNSIRTLVFDVLGTVVDEAGSVRSEFTGAMVAAGGTPQQGGELARAWSQRFDELLKAIHERTVPWRSTDDLYREALIHSLPEEPRLPKATVRHLAQVSHRLQPWPDAVDALQALSERFLIVALSNGNMSMLADMFRNAGLRWHCVLSGEMVHAYKPDPSVYRLAIDMLHLDPARTLMVAAHPWDLRAAATHGMRTAYIKRAGEGELRDTDRIDVAVDDLSELAAYFEASQEIGA